MRRHLFDFESPKIAAPGGGGVFLIPAGTTGESQRPGVRLPFGGVLRIIRATADRPPGPAATFAYGLHLDASSALAWASITGAHSREATNIHVTRGLDAGREVIGAAGQSLTVKLQASAGAISTAHRVRVELMEVGESATRPPRRREGEARGELA